MPEDQTSEISSQRNEPIQPVLEKPVLPNKKRFKSSTIAIFLVAILLIAGLVYAGMQIGKKQAEGGLLPKITPTLVPQPTEILDETASWKTYTNTKYGYSFKYPNDWDIWSINGSIDYPPLTPTPQPELGENLVLGYEKRSIKGIDKQVQMDVGIFDNPKKLKLKEYFIDQKWGKEYLDLMEDMTINNFEAINLKISGSPPGGYFINIGKYIIHIRFSYFESDEKFDISPQITFDQILSTFKFTETPSNTITPTGSTQTIGAKLTEIKYTLPEGWKAKLNKDNLLISPTSGGGYFSIRVVNYPGNIGRREYYCQVSGVCIEGTSYFIEMNIGNISGYVANALDNSGGGPEYFGAKGDKFYIISSFSPPSPNEFDKNYQSVLSSLIF